MHARASPIPRPLSRQKSVYPPPPMSPTPATSASMSSALLAAVTMGNHDAGHSITTTTNMATGAGTQPQVPIVSLPLVSPATGAAVALPDIQVLKTLAGRHILKVDLFSKVQLHSIFNLAQAYRIAVHKDRPLDHILRVGCLLEILPSSFRYD